MNNAALEERVAGISTWASSWESKTKLITAIIYIFGVISLQTIPVLLIAYTFVLFMLLISRISIILLLKRYLIITPFLLLMTVPLLWQYSVDNLTFASIIIIKAFISMTVITIVLETQSLDELMKGLAGLKMPPILITILILSYRYVFLFLDDIERLLTAAKSRFFTGGLTINSLKVYGQLIASLLVKAVQRSDKMYEAMASRGFTGKLTFQRQEKIQPSDIMKSVAAVCIVFVLIIVENL